MKRLIITPRVVADVDLDEVVEADDLDEADDVLGHYAGSLAGFLDNEVNNCAEMPGSVSVTAVSVSEVAS